MILNPEKGSPEVISVEFINGIQTIKSFALEDKFEEKWGDLQADYVKVGISFEMKENKVYGLVGRSGSGKSTIS